MELSITDNGSKVKGMAEENRYGAMALFMKDIGRIIRLMEKAD